MTSRKDNPSNQQLVVSIETDFSEQRINHGRFVFKTETWSRISANKLANLAPRFVICPLFNNRFDAIDVGKLLLDAKIDSKLLIKSPPLPRPTMVLREISDHCPELAVEFFETARWFNQKRLSA